jgi:hypothetical protein
MKIYRVNFSQLDDPNDIYSYALIEAYNEDQAKRILLHHKPNEDTFNGIISVSEVKLGTEIVKMAGNLNYQTVHNIIFGKDGAVV